ncbi:hypothetical protein [Nocardia nova]|uniref:hypothetical protein n=1 Tax=Nocardia nova TaxID=37330 RepID=UPI0007A3D625|nr:hypothetical protein [Nocardia nova]
MFGREPVEQSSPAAKQDRPELDVDHVEYARLQSLLVTTNLNSCPVAISGMLLASRRQLAIKPAIYWLASASGTGQRQRQ